MDTLLVIVVMAAEVMVAVAGVEKVLNMKTLPMARILRTKATANDTASIPKHQ
jgi:hypothetical protein